MTLEYVTIRHLSRGKHDFALFPITLSRTNVLALVKPCQIKAAQDVDMVPRGNAGTLFLMTKLAASEVAQAPLCKITPAMVCRGSAGFHHTTVVEVGMNVVAEL